MNSGIVLATAQPPTDQPLKRDAALIAQSGILDHITHIIPSGLMVLNSDLRIVYSNPKLLELLNFETHEEIFGLRFGEALRCIHAFNNEQNQPFSKFCGGCAAHKAIRKARKEQHGIETDCCISTCDGQMLDLKIWASPYHLEGADFLLFTVRDTRPENRKQALEQTFLHDMANVLMSITGLSRTLQHSADLQETSKSIEAIRMASEELTAEIWCYRKLVMAEKGELRIDLNQPVRSFDLIDELVALSPQREIRLDALSEDFEFCSDRTLLFRVLFNMVKNAHEAANAEQPVTLSCRRESEKGVFSVHNPNYIPTGIQEKIFQRSFTTKRNGYGLGTYSMRLFGEKFLKGHVGFTTSRKNGTTFYISLPLEASS